MAKSRKQQQEQELLRQSRKEVLLDRRRARQTRQLRLMVVFVAAAILLVLIVGFVVERVIEPTQPVAVVSGEELSLGDWQQRVRYQRAQLVLGIEQLADALGGDIGQVQQLAGQQMQLLSDPPSFGQTILDEQINEILIRQEAERRGIVVTDEEVQAEIEQNFNFFDGESPTPLPTPTQTIPPTPSLTPIPTPVITEVVPTSTPFPTATAGPTSTPLPTATPVSAEGFQQEYQDYLRQLGRYGIREQQYRELVRAQLLRERVRDALAEEAAVPTEEEQVSFWYITFESEEEARSARERALQEEFLTVWNEIRSQPVVPDEPRVGFASEMLWRGRESLASTLSEEIAAEAFRLPFGVPSRVLTIEAETDEASDRHFLIAVSGREVRPLNEGTINNRKEQVLQTWLEAQRIDSVETFDRWRGNVPTRPILDPRFFVQPTPVPPTPTIDLPIATPAAELTPAG